MRKCERVRERERDNYLVHAGCLRVKKTKNMSVLNSGGSYLVGSEIFPGLNAK